MAPQGVCAKVTDRQSLNAQLVPNDPNRAIPRADGAMLASSRAAIASSGR